MDDTILTKPIQVGPSVILGEAEGTAEPSNLPTWTTPPNTENKPETPPPEIARSPAP